MDLQNTQGNNMDVNKLNKIIKLLPGYNCKACGYKRCDIFAEELLNGETSPDKCPFLFREDFKGNMKELKELLKDIDLVDLLNSLKESMEKKLY